LEKQEIVLGIETSCDETAAALVADGASHFDQHYFFAGWDLHAVYGGVVPELASRRHVELIVPVVDRALAEANLTFADLSAIAVTAGPGLVGALLVGLSYAKGVAIAQGITSCRNSSHRGSYLCQYYYI
jgi:N6-L-threonylcarbamoyladenine synthase